MQEIQFGPSIKLIKSFISSEWELKRKEEEINRQYQIMVLYAVGEPVWL